MDLKILCLFVFVALAAVVCADEKKGAEQDVGKAIKHLFHEKIEKKMKEAASEVQDILQDNLVEHVKKAAKSLMEPSHKKKKVTHKPKKVKHEEKKVDAEDDMEEPPVEGEEAMKDEKPVKAVSVDAEGNPPPPLHPPTNFKPLPRLCSQPNCPANCAPQCYDECCEGVSPAAAAAPAPAPSMDGMAMDQMNQMNQEGYQGCPAMCMDQCLQSCPQNCCSWDKKHTIHHPKNKLKKHLKKQSKKAVH